MNAARLQNLIYAGYAKEAARTGFDYDLYHPGSTLEPLDPGWFVETIPCSFISDEKGTVANKYQTPTWTLRADGRKLALFDFLVGPFGTFYVSSMQPQLPLEVVRCNAIATIGRTVYAGTSVSVVPYCTGLPIFKQYRREDIRRDQTGNEIGNAITHWRAFIPLPNHTLKQGDVLTDTSETPNISYTVDAPDFTSSGYAANIRLASI